MTNGPTANSNAVAEHTVAMIGGDHEKSSMRAIKSMRSGYFNFRNEHLTGDLEGKTVGILGTGRIGRLVAKKCHFGFDMKILGYESLRHRAADYIRPACVEEIFREADYISLHLPPRPKNQEF